MEYTLSQIIEITGGRALGEESEVCLNRVVTSLLTDSRDIDVGVGSLFFAITTASNSGQRYMEDLYDRGVRAFVVEQEPGGLLSGATYIVVTSVVGALQRVGECCRAHFGGDVVAVTGSRGKTVVKEWIYTCLSPFMRAVRSPRSYNSQIGVPLSLWLLSTSDEVGVFEAGISRPGEMEHLAQMLQPQVVVLTGVGSEHAEGFDSRPQHLAEKLLLAQNAQILVYDADDTDVQMGLSLMPDLDDKLLVGISRTDKESPIYIKEIKPEQSGTDITYTFRGREESLFLPFREEWMVKDALLALGALLVLGREPGQIAWSMRSLQPVRTRIDVSDGVNDCLLASDTFTCDLHSLLTALNFMSRRADESGRKRTLILADPRPEDMDPAQMCRRIAELCGLANIKRFIGVGDLLCRHKELFPEGAVFYPSASAMMQHLSTSDFESEFILIKGEPNSGLHPLLENLQARTHETVLEVNLDAIVANYNYFRSQLPLSTGLIAMVKASAYGAGSLEVAKTLQAQGASYLAVAVLDEGIELRRAGITMPIMVMNPKVLNYRAMFQYGLEPEIYSLQMLRDVIREGEKCGVKAYPVHIKLDTGMHRMGFNQEEIPTLIGILTSTSTVRAATLFSHLATADALDMDEYTLAQLARFEEFTRQIMQALPYTVKRHVLNSAGILRFPQYHYDFARLGIGLYGVNTLPSEIEKPLARVSTLRTVIISLKHLKKGEAVGYGRCGILERDSLIATIPIGYADGMNRRFGRGRSSVVVNGREAPTIGNICMDACMVDVTGIPCRVGDSVEIFGPSMAVERLAQVLDTIPYEVITSVSPRVRRVYYHE